VARQTTAAVDSHLHRAFLDVVELGRTPTLRVAVSAANQRPVDADAIARLDDIWTAGDALPPDGARVLQGPAAEFLVDVARYDQTYLELLLTDREGRLVAASSRVSDYDQNDAALWLAMRIAEPPLDSDMHLVHHSPVMHVGETDEPILADEEAV